MSSPVVFEWTDDGTMRPLKRFTKLCDQQFVVGALYRMAELEERSAATHRHYFAALHEAWLNLPEEITNRFPDEDDLRKWALIETNHCDVRSFQCNSKKEAMRLASFLTPKAGGVKIEVNGTTVIEKIAHSQSMRSMGKEIFQKSKSDVLDYVAALIGVPTQSLMKEAESAPSIAPHTHAKETERV